MADHPYPKGVWFHLGTDLYPQFFIPTDWQPPKWRDTDYAIGCRIIGNEGERFQYGQVARGLLDMSTITRVEEPADAAT